MSKEELDDLLSIDANIRMDAERILFALEQAPDGFTTTYRQADAEIGRAADMDFHYLFDLGTALMLLCENHGLKLDASRHDGLIEGLPFHLDYDVWHRNNAATNGMFDDEVSPQTVAE